MKVKGDEGTIASRKIAFLVDDGVSKKSVDKMRKALMKEGAMVVLVSSHVGNLRYLEGDMEEVQHSYLTDSSVCFDGFYTPAGDNIDKLGQNPDYLQFVNEGYRHCKALAFAKEAEKLIGKSFIEKDAAVNCESAGANWINDFIQALKKHRIWERENSRKVPS